MRAFPLKAGCPTLAAAIALLFLFSAHAAEDGGRDPQITVLADLNRGPYKAALEGFKRYLEERGAKATYRIVDTERAAANADGILNGAGGGRPDLCFSLGSNATRVAIRESNGIPVVGGMVLDHGLLARAEHASGVTMQFPVHDQLQWVKRVLPESGTIGVIYSTAENQSKVDAAAIAAEEMGLKIDAQKVSSPKDLPRALRLLSRSADVMWGLEDEIVLTPRTAKNILLFSFRHRIPLVGISENWVKAGALYSLGWDYVDLGRQCGEVALKVLNGTPIASIPPEGPRITTHFLNTKTARHMRIDVPDDLARSAEKVY